MSTKHKHQTHSDTEQQSSHFTKGIGFLSHHRFSSSLGGPLIRIVATIEKLYPYSSHHHGANHQHLIVNNIKVEYSEGLPPGMEVSQEIFVAVRFGDHVGLVDPVPFVEGKMTRLQGEYIDSADAYSTPENPGLSVLHFTHHPAGFVDFPVGEDVASLHYS